MPLTLLQLNPERIIDFPLRESIGEGGSGSCQGVTVNLRLTNVSNGPVAYKIKTTAPKNYLVRPSSGVLGASEKRDVQIVLQPNAANNNAAVVNDRFLVQATSITSLNTTVNKEFWSEIPKEQLEDQRLSVTISDRSASSAPAAPAPPAAPSAHPRSISSLSATNQNNTAAADSSNYETRYNDLLQYSVSLEKQKNLLTRELEALRRQHPNAMTNTGFLGSFRFELIHVLIAIVITALVARLL